MSDFKRKMKKTISTIKFIFNIPDYEKYVENHKGKSCCTKLMTEKEFYEYCLKEKYESGKVNSCC